MASKKELKQEIEDLKGLFALYALRQFKDESYEVMCTAALDFDKDISRIKLRRFMEACKRSSNEKERILNKAREEVKMYDDFRKKNK